MIIYDSLSFTFFRNECFLRNKRVDRHSRFFFYLQFQNLCCYMNISTGDKNCGVAKQHSSSEIVMF